MQIAVERTWLFCQRALHWSKKGQAVIDMNNELVDAAADACVQVKVPASLNGVKHAEMLKLIPDDADDFAKKIIEPSMRNEGDSIPVSAMSIDGTLPIGTAALEKRGFAPKVPKWVSANCIQCGICASACPHAAIRTKLFKVEDLAKAPATFTTKDPLPKAEGLKFKVQVYVEDCMGCHVNPPTNLAFSFVFLPFCDYLYWFCLFPDPRS